MQEEHGKEEALAVVRKKASEMDQMLDAFQVTSDEELEAVADKIKSVKTFKKVIEQKKESYVQPAKDIIAKAREEFDPWIKKCENAEITLKERAKRYMVAKDEKRRKAEEKIAAKVESGQMKPETAVKKMEALPEAPKTVSTDKGSGLRMAKRTVAVVVEPDAQRAAIKAMMQAYGEKHPDFVGNIAPADYWTIDEVRLKRDTLALYKASQPILSGTRITEETDLHAV